MMTFAFVLVLLAGLVVLLAAASSNPALAGSAAWMLVLVLPYRVCLWLRNRTGGFRYTEKNPDPAKLDDIDVPVLRPTKVGRFFGLLVCAIQRRVIDGAAWDMTIALRPFAATEQLRMARRERRMLEGATWRDLASEGLLLPGESAAPGSILRTRFDLEATRTLPGKDPEKLSFVVLVEPEARTVAKDMCLDGWTVECRSSPLGPTLEPMELSAMRVRIEELDEQFEALSAVRDEENVEDVNAMIEALKAERASLERKLYGETAEEKASRHGYAVEES